MPEREQDEQLDNELENLLPPVKPAREGDETRAARCLMELIGGKKLAPADVRWLLATNVGFDWTGRGGSWNIQQIRMASKLWHFPDANGGMQAPDWWLDYLRCQLGEVDAFGFGNIKEPDDPLFFFGGTEQGSNTYEGWRWGAALAVRLWALRNCNHPAAQTLLRLTARYSEVQTALLALGAAPGPTKAGDILVPTNGAGEEARLRPVPIHTNSRGQLWWQGPSLPMSGNRSTPAHVGLDERMPMYASRVHSRGSERFGWPSRVAELLPASEIPVRLETLTETALSGIRLRTPHHFARWQEEGIRANWIERLGNKNTTSILGHVTYEKEQRAVYLFPWAGRLRRGLGEASCELVAPDPGTGGWRELVARSRFGEVRHELPERDPDSHIVVGPNGLEVL